MSIFTEENILNIMNGKDLSKGLFVFINEGQDNDNMLENMKNILGLTEVSWIQGLNACNVYYIK